MARYISYDLALRHTGWAAGSIGPGKFTVSRIGTIDTEKRWTDLKAGHYLYKHIWHLIQGKTVVMAEIPYGAQSARAAWSLGVSIGVISGIVAMLPKHKKFIAVKPSAVKAVLKLTTKTEIIDWAINEYPNLDWHYHLGKLTQAHNEHMADAIGVALATYKAGKWT